MSLQQLYDEWFAHPEWWFNNESIDSYLTNTYSYLLTNAPQPANQQESIGLILLYDQIARHVYRHNLETINHYLNQAVQHSQLVYKTFLEFTTEEYCFIMLPLRHTNQLNHITYVIKETLQRFEFDNNPLLRRFFKATFDKYKFDPNTVVKSSLDIDISEFKDILEYYPKEIIKYNRIMGIIDLPKQSYIISLSGGVDSMLCAYVMKQQGYDITAVHINYNNRSVREEEFVVSWCTMMEIPLYVRRITEIQREPCMKHGFRDLYESYTKSVRFNTYRTVCNHPNVVLGHNEDDCFENILTNLCKESHYENLKGMSKESMIDGIRFYRPLLNTPKSSIYIYAKIYQIPYLQDSTPSWSQRGKIRDKVRPVMKEWNPLLIRGLLNVPLSLQNMDLLLKDIVQDAIDKTHNNTFDIDNKPHYITLTQFWNKYLNQMFGIHVSHKSLDQFVDKIKKEKSCKVILNKRLICQLTKTVCIFLVMQ